MIKLPNFIAGESLVLDDITHDNIDSTPFDSTYICYATTYNRGTKEIIDPRIEANDRADENLDPFVINILPTTTELWPEWVIIVITVEKSDETLRGKTTIEVHCERY
jgi:hypothetical protein